MVFTPDLKVKDLQYNGKGVFYYINEYKALPFIDLIEIESLDLGFQMLHGERVLSPFIKNKMLLLQDEDILIEVSKVLSLMFSSKWERLFDTYTKDLELDTYKLETTEKVIETGNRNSTRDDNTLSNRKNLVNSFDSEVLQDKDNEVYDSNYKTVDTGNTEHNSDLTKVVKGNINNRLTDVSKVIRLLKDDLINDILYTDVRDFISLSIY